MSIIDPKKIIAFAALCLSMGITAQNSAPFNALDYQLQKRARAKKLESERFSDNTFMSAAIGSEAVLASSTSLLGTPGLKFQLQYGKWFTETQGVRLGIESSINQRFRDTSLPFHSGIVADYLFNLSSHIWGYNPNRPFEVQFVTGLGAHYNMYDDESSISVGFGAGLRADIRVSSMVDLFLEPKLNFYTNGYYPTEAQTWMKGFWSPSMMLGVTYNMIPKDNRIGLSPFFTTPFGENLFLSLSGGGEFTLRSNGQYRSLKWPIGPSGAVSIGSWLTPSSGVRLTFSSGFSGLYPDGSDKEIKLKRSTAQADYMLNLHSMFGGYRRSDIFNLYAILGLNANLSQRYIPTSATEGINKRNFQVGGGLGVQANFRVHDNFSLYIEPRVNIYPSSMAGGVTHSKFDALTQLMAGVTYRRTEREDRLKNGKQNFSGMEQWFIEAGAGANAILSGDLRTLGFDGIKPQLSLAAGKWFNQYSALRLKLSAGFLGEIGQTNNSTEFVSGDIDYIFSLTNIMNGYNPKRIFDLNGVVGLSGIYNSGTTPEVGDSKLNFGVGAGLQAMFNINPAFGIFVEPRVTAYVTNSLARGDVGMLPIDLLSSVSAGLTYRFNMVDKMTNRLGASADNHARGFISLAGGLNGLVQAGGFTSKNYAPSFYAGFGKWITPLAAFRVGAEGALIPESGGYDRYTEYASVGVDFMTSLSNLVTPYRRDRVFNLNAFAGVVWGASYTKDEASNFKSSSFNAFVPSLRAGVQGAFRVSDAIELYLEPQLGFYPMGNLEYLNSIEKDLLFTARAGITYRIMAGNMAVKTKRYRDGDILANTFVSASLGAGAYAERLQSGFSSEVLTVESSLSFGKWFNNLSGLRLSVYNSNMDDTSSPRYARFDVKLIGLHLDYMLNMSNLLSGPYEDRKFEVIGIIGMGYDHISASNGKGGAIAGSVNVQGLYNLNKHWGIYVEPSAMLFLNKLTGRSFISSYKLNGVGKLMLGTQYRF
ncbi:MAG: hypothetical protein ACRC6V_13735 [Bacteroidales bacterium]